MVFSFAYRKRKIAKSEYPAAGIFKEERTIGTRDFPLSIG
jgi:hypothetical protein